MAYNSAWQAVYHGGVGMQVNSVCRLQRRISTWIGKMQVRIQEKGCWKHLQP